MPTIRRRSRYTKRRSGAKRYTKRSGKKRSYRGESSSLYEQALRAYCKGELTLDCD